MLTHLILGDLLSLDYFTSDANMDVRYAARGVSSGKEDVHAAIANIDKGLFPLAFCKIIPDTLR